jgi:hypothetical protein
MVPIRVQRAAGVEENGLSEVEEWVKKRGLIISLDRLPR